MIADTFPEINSTKLMYRQLCFLFNKQSSIVFLIEKVSTFFEGSHIFTIQITVIQIIQPSMHQIISFVLKKITEVFLILHIMFKLLFANKLTF